MSLILTIIAIACFLIAAMLEYGWLGASGEHVIGWIAVGLVAFAAAHLPWPGYFRR